MIHTVDKKEVVRKIVESLRQLKDSGISTEDILTVMRELSHEPAPAPGIPVSIFSRQELGALEAIVIFLREYRQLKFTEIGHVLNRSPISLSTSYRSARQKFNEHLNIDDKAIHIPYSLFSDRSVSVQRHLVRYLHDTHHLKFSEIARLLARDPRTIWTAYHAKGGDRA